MTTRVLKGSKQEIAGQIAALEGDVREVVVYIDEPVPQLPVPATVEELFAEMEPYTVKVGDVDDSREAIYTRMEGE
jgi:hypothetical protein